MSAPTLTVIQEELARLERETVAENQRLRDQRDTVLALCAVSPDGLVSVAAIRGALEARP